ncbi:MAG TPA: flagellar assembly peptidoglycan hydrolase FlgJ [Chromatiales bacterium]|nr:flagellar assembly peptidoglycan hydrolase FlgJ [Chromatiales bacterium]
MSAGTAVGFYADFAAMAELRARAGRDRAGALGEAARELEALFLETLLKSMREATPGDPLLGGAGLRLYREVHDRQLARQLAARGSLGLARLIVRQLGGSGMEPSGTGGPAVPVAAARAPARAAPAPPTAGRGPDYADAREFVARLWPHARRAARALGVPPETLLAQAALETGWGRRVPRRSDGMSSHNLFGIKAGAGWRGPVAVVRTLEHGEEGLRAERARFRAYASPAEAFDDYVALVRTSPRYRAALAAGDAEGYLRALAAGGYATDPRYAEKVLAVLRGPRLAAALKAAGARPIA